MKDVLYKTMYHFFKDDFSNWIGTIKDPRNKEKIEYPLEHLIWVGILLFLNKLEARRQIKYFFDTEQFIDNLNILAGGEVEKVAHPDTLGYLLERITPAALSYIRIKMVNKLIRMRVLEQFRLVGKYYLIAIDGTGYLAFKKKHCDRCLVKKNDNKILYYYHNVLEAKIICDNGMALSIGTEFIENEDRGYDKQDCELRAFYRLEKDLKKEFPQLAICLLLDALYAGKPVFDICRENGWKYIITFKEGSMPEVYGEYKSLKALCAENSGEDREGNIYRKYNWVREMEYKGHSLNALECNESRCEKDGKRVEKKFVWLSNMDIDKNNFKEVAKGGRLRWKTENEGFNIQKNGGYNMEHGYSYNTVGMKNFYLLMQIAHIINQLMEKGSLLKEVQKVFGSIRNIARKLLEDLRTQETSKDEFFRLVSVPFQIRFNSS